MRALRGRVLAIGGSDPSGGAGVQADLKTIAAFGAYGATAITALTVQDTTAVTDAIALPARFVHDQIVAVLGDIGADAIKTGMLADPAIVEAVCDALAVLTRRLLPLASLLTPNLPEAETLCGMAIPD